jgi:hypothetical protein
VQTMIGQFRISDFGFRIFPPPNLAAKGMGSKSEIRNPKSEI